jgi:8-oxo-dGTP pyrophosphatase MutT (NUDIX family)
MAAKTFAEVMKSSPPTEETTTQNQPGGDSFSIFKTDDDKRLVFGWASISITVDGEQLEDRQKDIIDPEDLEEAAYEYVLNFRDTGEEHISTMRKKGKLVESCVFTAEKQKAIGIPKGTLPIGWWIGFKIEDDAAWARVKNGTYKMFSIEGKANREPVEKGQLKGCGVLVVQNGKILTGTRIERNSRGKICGPGGHIEEGETPEQAAKREAREEFGIKCQELTPLGTLKDGSSAIFLCTKFTGTPETDEEEMTETKWRTIDELMEENLFRPFEESLEFLGQVEKSRRDYDEYPEYGMWLEENLDATIDEQKTAKEYYAANKEEARRKWKHAPPSVAKTFSEVLKFNPYHDAKGRFASANGYASFTMQTKDPKKQHWADKAIARMKQQAAANPPAPPKPATPPKPQKNYDKRGFADYDDADYHQLYNGRQYYAQQKLSVTEQNAAANYLSANPEPGSLYSHCQNMNYKMATGQTLTGQYKKTYDGMMSSMHNIGYNVELTRYDHAGFLNGMLKSLGVGTDYERMSQASIKKALVGQTVNENKFLSTSYNNFKNATNATVFTSRAVKINYKVKAGTQAMMPGKGPGGDFGEIVLAPTNGKANKGGKIVDVRLTGKMARRQGTQTYNQPQIEIDIEIG